MKEYKKHYRLEQREEIIDYHKQYYQANKERIKQRTKAYKLNNAEKVKSYPSYQKEYVREKNKQYRKDHLEILKAKQAERYSTKQGRARVMVIAYKRIDRLKNTVCTLTPEWMVDNIFSGQTCHWCGETDWQKLGCDRIDNTKPHTPDNVVPSCWDCNNKRNGASYDFFKMMHTPIIVKIWN